MRTIKKLKIRKHSVEENNSLKPFRDGAVFGFWGKNTAMKIKASRFVAPGADTVLGKREFQIVFSFKIIPLRP